MYDVIIIGAGIAGLSAGLYCSRLKMKTLIISKDIGGQLTLAPEIQNYPGFASIRGFDLIMRIYNQIKSLSIDMVYDEVTKIEEEDEQFVVYTTSNQKFTALSLILAFGKSPRELNVPGEQEFRGKGVSYCAICDAPLYKGKTVALAGIGDAGIHAAIVLSDVVNKCHWVFPTPTPTQDLDLLEAIKSRNNLKLYPNSRIIEIKGDKRVTAIVIENIKTKEKTQINVNGVFIEMGYIPKTSFVKGFVQLNDKGEIIVNEVCETSRKGVFAAGDVTNMPYKQAIISAGQGAVAALSAYNYVAQIKGYRQISREWSHISNKQHEKKGGLFFKV